MGPKAHRREQNGDVLSVAGQGQGGSVPCFMIPRLLPGSPGHPFIDAGNESCDGPPPSCGVMVTVDTHNHRQLQL